MAPAPGDLTCSAPSWGRSWWRSTHFTQAGPLRPDLVGWIIKTWPEISLGESCVLTSWCKRTGSDSQVRFQSELPGKGSLGVMLSPVNTGPRERSERTAPQFCSLTPPQRLHFHPICWFAGCCAGIMQKLQHGTTLGGRTGERGGEEAVKLWCGIFFSFHFWWLCETGCFFHIYINSQEPRGSFWEIPDMCRRWGSMRAAYISSI